MAYRPLSAIVAERLAQIRGDKPIATETHHIATPRQHDIERLLQKEEPEPPPPPHFDKSLLDQVRQRPAAPDYSHGVAESSRLLREARHKPAIKPVKFTERHLKQIRESKRPGF